MSAASSSRVIMTSPMTRPSSRPSVTTTGGGRWTSRARRANRTSEQPQELVERVHLGPDGVADRRAGALGRGQHQVGDVLHRDGLHAVAAVARHRVERQVAQQPGHVVDQDLLARRRTRATAGSRRARASSRPAPARRRPCRESTRAASRARGSSPTGGRSCAPPPAAPPRTAPGCSRPHRRTSRRRAQTGSSTCSPAPRPRRAPARAPRDR